jgi:hypothetical protein
MQQIIDYSEKYRQAIKVARVTLMLIIDDDKALHGPISITRIREIFSKAYFFD